MRDKLRYAGYQDETTIKSRSDVSKMARRFCFFNGVIANLFFLAVSVAAHELINTTCSVDEFLFAGEERM